MRISIPVQASGMMANTLSLMTIINGSEFDMTEFKDALEWMNHEFRGRTIYQGHPIQVIEKALRIADRLMQEPSHGMLEEGYSDDDGEPYRCNRDIFKAMRDQMLAEIDNADGDGV
ncbi:hypothetical protein LZD49_33615 [Dyadobacter sp. CY261]|uniref:hypothetical protein n=1 Tax=Dyadobacter sp. CY261 TaxID=2907203 RepID=UPI001F325D27|nr:hypothetical protein [Dyadobacter sp. CY261]MCF0075466.1 hypothetical protein [Dyadobacter sp. CY261]